jgi:hypothetical protein
VGGKLENKSRWNQDQADHTSRLVESIHTYPFSTSLGARSILVVHEIIMLDLLDSQPARKQHSTFNWVDARANFEREFEWMREALTSLPLGTLSLSRNASPTLLQRLALKP